MTLENLNFLTTFPQKGKKVKKRRTRTDKRAIPRTSRPDPRWRRHWASILGTYRNIPHFPIIQRKKKRDETKAFTDTNVV